MAEIGGRKRRSTRSSFGPMSCRGETEHFVPEHDEEEAETLSGKERYRITIRSRCRHWRRKKNASRECVRRGAAQLQSDHDDARFYNYIKVHLMFQDSSHTNIKAFSFFHVFKFSVKRILFRPSGYILRVLKVLDEQSLQVQYHTKRNDLWKKNLIKQCAKLVILKNWSVIFG